MSTWSNPAGQRVRNKNPWRPGRPPDVLKHTPTTEALGADRTPEGIILTVNLDNRAGRAPIPTTILKP